MIVQQQIRHSFEHITKLLDNKELYLAFEAIRELLPHAKAPETENALNIINETYCNLLNYFIEGVKDPMQSVIYRDVLTATYELSDKLRLQITSTCDGAPMYFAYRKKWRAIPGVSIGTLLQQLIVAHTGSKDIEETVFMLFNKIWLSDPFSPEDVQALSAVLSDAQVPYVAGCQIVSALFLSQMSYFDIRKLMLMLDAFDHGGNEEVRVRAITGALIIMYMYRARLSLYPQIGDRLAALADQQGFVQKLRIIMLRFILAKETERITDKLKNDIIPAMANIVPNLMSRHNMDFDPEIFSEVNPEWQKLFSNKDMERRLEEYNRLHSEGADVMHHTFTHLKNYDFFREIGNWFLPFMPDHSRLNYFVNDEIRQTVMKLTTALAFLCNSDKYSFALSLMRQPQAGNTQLIGQFFDQMHEVMEQNRNDMVSNQRNFEMIVGQYVQDLYRFFKLYQFARDFSDIFEWKLDFYDMPFIGEYLSDNESLSIFAEYYLKKNRFEDALALFQRLSKANHKDDMLYQKIGYCHQMLGQTAEALTAYLRADLINTDNKWLTKRIGVCYRALGQPDKALPYYLRLESLSPDNLSVPLGIGHCLLEQGEYTEALKYYFKVEYLDSTGTLAPKALAWCLFLAGRYEDALVYYAKILAGEVDNDLPDAVEFVRYGHAAWAAGQPERAASLYMDCIYFEHIEFEEFLRLFNRDTPHLLAAGISPEEIPLMIDKVRIMWAEFKAGRINRPKR
ncbi:MAG: tetratricopeptide repeat protein [Tannerellaceae bacterium]|jgi:tetratricopeptide (TPR) repeat protein|nr:tetratricopeptide repeat protein [Tannerellaceae bacterium]